MSTQSYLSMEGPRIMIDGRERWTERTKRHRSFPSAGDIYGPSDTTNRTFSRRSVKCGRFAPQSHTPQLASTECKCNDTDLDSVYRKCCISVSNCQYIIYYTVAAWIIARRDHELKRANVDPCRHSANYACILKLQTTPKPTSPSARRLSTVALILLSAGTT